MSEKSVPVLHLASGSPRRREILESIGIAIVVKPANADETVLPGEAPGAYLERVVLAKLAAAPKVEGTAAVLVADTSVIDGRQILGKPGSIEEAASMIGQLAGRTHEVWTRFAIGRDGAVVHAETVKTRVTFRALTPEQIQAYAASGEGLDKAGAYAVQGLGAAIVSRIEGSYSNVVGLPACEVAVALENAGLRA